MKQDSKEDLLAPKRGGGQRQRRRQRAEAEEAAARGSCGGRGVSCAAYNDEILNQTGSGDQTQIPMANQSR
jgi:hypothetical protein